MSPREKLIALRDALRKPMPEGLGWHYSDWGVATDVDGFVAGFLKCGCALSLAGNLGLIKAKLVDEEGELRSLAIVFGLATPRATRIFLQAHLECSPLKNQTQVTPPDVADVIDRVLAEMGS